MIRYYQAWIESSGLAVWDLHGGSDTFEFDDEDEESSSEDDTDEDDESYDDESFDDPHTPVNKTGSSQTEMGDATDERSFDSEGGMLS